MASASARLIIVFTIVASAVATSYRGAGLSYRGKRTPYACSVSSCVNIGERCGEWTSGIRTVYLNCDPLSAYCKKASDSDNGTCVLLLSPGSTCTDHEQCQDNWLYNIDSSRKRTTPRALAGPCINGKCVKFGLKVGEACSHNESCMLTGICTNGKCADYTYAALGQNCSDWGGIRCDKGLDCYNGKCTHLATVGEACPTGSCAGYCDYDTSMCNYRNLGLGQNCSNWIECKEGLFCGEGKCLQKLPVVHQNCTADSNCSNFYTCACTADGQLGCVFQDEDRLETRWLLEDEINALGVLGGVSSYESEIVDLMNEYRTFLYCGTSKASRAALSVAVSIILAVFLL